jgi:hypothetical protein
MRGDHEASLAVKARNHSRSRASSVIAIQAGLRSDVQQGNTSTAVQPRQVVCRFFNVIALSGKLYTALTARRFSPEIHIQAVQGRICYRENRLMLLMAQGRKAYPLSSVHFPVGFPVNTIFFCWPIMSLLFHQPQRRTT